MLRNQPRACVVVVNNEELLLHHASYVKLSKWHDSDDEWAEINDLPRRGQPMTGGHSYTKVLKICVRMGGPKEYFVHARLSRRPDTAPR
jgi:hypothetical protein